MIQSVPVSSLREQFGQIDIYLFDQILRGRITPGMRILDAGCGDGRTLIYLMRTATSERYEGQLMSACALLKKTPHPTDEDVDAAMSKNICRCGTCPRIRAAIHMAAEGSR